MKKLLTMFAAVVLVLGMTLSAQAALITITFDESGRGISSTEPDYPGNTDIRYDGTQISTQYSDLGVTWEDTNTDPNLTGQVVTVDDEFAPDWYGAYNHSNILWSISNSSIMLDSPANSLSFDYRRPKAGGSMTVALYLDGTLLFPAQTLSWSPADPIEDSVWNHYEYSGSLFNHVEMTIGTKWVTDNYTFNTVPIPSAFWLLGSGLLLVIRRRKS